MEPIAGGRLRRLTAFSTSRDGGNRAGVWVGDALPSPQEMQSIASYVGFSETAFLAQAGDRVWVTRYYAPAAEVSFCGHATIAAGVALSDTHGPGRFELDTAAGLVPVEVDVVDGRAVASLTSVEPEHEPASDGLLGAVLALLGWSDAELNAAIPPARAYAGAWHLVLAVAELKTLKRLDYDFDAMRKVMEDEGLTTLQLVFRDGEAKFESRNPFPVGGVVEDPATGAAAAAQGGYLRAIGAVAAPARLTISQGVDMGRPSTLEVLVPVEGGVVVSGPAVDLDD